MEEPVSINILHNECLTQIFNMFEDPAELCNLQLVCHRWRKLINYCWKSKTRILIDEHWKRKENPCFTFFRLLNKCPNLKRIEFVACFNYIIHPVVIQPLSDVQPKLEQILVNELVMPSISLPLFGTLFPNLNTLEIEYCKTITDSQMHDFFKLPNLPKLTNFSFTGNRSNTCNWLTKIPDSLKRLRLDSLMNYDWINTLAVRCGQNITHLEVVEPLGEKYIWDILSKLPNLVFLKIDEYQQLTLLSKYEMKITRKPEMELDTLMLYRIIRYWVFCFASTLQTVCLIIEKHTILTPDFLTEIGKKLRKLNRFSIYSLDNDQAIAIAKSFCHLYSLRILNTNDLTKEGMAFLMKRQPVLAQLRLGGSASQSHLFSYLPPKMDSLDAQINFDSLRKFIPTHGAQVRRLVIREKLLITHLSIILKEMPQLKTLSVSLDLSKNDEIIPTTRNLRRFYIHGDLENNNPDLESILQALPNLEELHLINIYVSNDFMKNLHKTLPKLETFSMYGCFVLSTSLLYLTDCPSLKFLILGTGVPCPCDLVEEIVEQSSAVRKIYLCIREQAASMTELLKKQVNGKDLCYNRISSPNRMLRQYPGDYGDGFDIIIDNQKTRLGYPKLILYLEKIYKETRVEHSS